MFILCIFVDTYYFYDLILKIFRIPVRLCVYIFIDNLF